MSDKRGRGLCHRCEHRVRSIEEGHAIEEGHGPRCECGNRETAVYRCYMYMPVQPVVLVNDTGDKRPVQGPWLLSARLATAGLPKDGVLKPVTVEVKHNGRKGCITYWDYVEPVKKNRKKTKAAKCAKS